MTRALLVAALCGLVATAAAGAQEAAAAGPEEAVRRIERDWNAAIKQRDVARMDEFIADGYFLAVGIEGQPLAVVPRQVWLKNLPVYKIEEMTIGDMQVHVYGDVAVAVMLYSQKATVPGGRDVNGNFLLTDVWIKTPKGWRVAERHSSRQEKLPAARPSPP